MPSAESQRVSGYDLALQCIDFIGGLPAKEGATEGKIRCLEVATFDNNRTPGSVHDAVDYLNTKSGLGNDWRFTVDSFPLDQPQTIMGGSLTIQSGKIISAERRTLDTAA